MYYYTNFAVLDYLWTLTHSGKETRSDDQVFRTKKTFLFTFHLIFKLKQALILLKDAKNQTKGELTVVKDVF